MLTVRSRSAKMSTWRNFSHLIVMATWTALTTDLPSVATTVLPITNFTPDDPVDNRLTVEYHMFNSLLRQQQFLDGSSSSSSLTSTLPLAIYFDDNDEYYVRHRDGQVRLRSGVDERRLVELLTPIYFLPLNPHEDRRPVIEVLIDLFNRRRRSTVIVDDRPEVNEYMLAAKRRPLERVNEIDLLLFLADVIDRTLNVNQRRANGETTDVSDVGHERRLERCVDDLRVVVNASYATVPESEREAVRSMRIHISDDNETLPLWKQFENNINQYELYSKEDEPMVDELVRLLTTLPVIRIGEVAYGTNLKLLFRNIDMSHVLFKPKRHDRYYEVPLEVLHYRDTERHLAEIAAYHLDRTLGFRRVPPVSGVRVDFTEHMRQLLSPQLLETFYESPDGNLCFFGLCKHHCEVGKAVCGNGKLVEGSIAYVLPVQNVAQWSDVSNPWSQSYDPQILLAEWEIKEKSTGYCDHVRETPPFDSERALVNLIDVHIFDFLQGNLDRHNFVTYKTYGKDSYFIAFDNGRGFGRANHDELSILAPLYQCCTVRLSTVKTLLDLQTSPPSSSSSSSGGGRLSDRMRRSLSSNPLSPVLSDAHLEALDRRVGLVLDQIHQCLQRSDGSRQVIVNY